MVASADCQRRKPPLFSTHVTSSPMRNSLPGNFPAKGQDEPQSRRMSSPRAIWLIRA
jgi:hypothetical protein